MKQLQKNLIKFSKSVSNIEENAKSIEVSTNDFAAIIEQSTNSIDQLCEVLEKINKDQYHVTKNIEETYQQALSIIN